MCEVLTLGKTAGNEMHLKAIKVCGIGTALKILFNDVQKLKLRRTEIVALFNALGR